MSQLGATLASRYVLHRQLAAGGNARVLEAEDTKLGRPVAVKMLAPAFTSLEEASRRLEREGRLAGQVAHPNVCAVLDSGTTSNGAPFLVFELLAGQTLADRLERTRTVPVDQAVRIIEQLLSAVGAVHSRGIVHRDIKPSNIFLCDLILGTPLVKLLDFGTAMLPGDEEIDGAQLTSTGFVVGTAEYMSPEQVRGLRDFDARTDIYSCGVVLYEMLTGKRPFADLALHELLHAIGFERPRPVAEVNPRVPRSVAHAVDVALSTARERRHADVSAFLAALRSSQAPPMTAATRVVSVQAQVPGAGEPADWDLETRETGPPDSSFGADAPDSSTVARPMPPKR